MLDRLGLLHPAPFEGSAHDPAEVGPPGLEVGVLVEARARRREQDDLAPAARAGVEIQELGTLERAVESAAARAQPGEVVLLSPACASFDAFEDFEERGERFRELVRGLS